MASQVTESNLLAPRPAYLPIETLNAGDVGIGEAADLFHKRGEFPKIISLGGGLAPVAFFEDSKVTFESRKSGSIEGEMLDRDNTAVKLYLNKSSLLKRVIAYALAEEQPVQRILKIYPWGDPFKTD